MTTSLVESQLVEEPADMDKRILCVISNKHAHTKGIRAVLLLLPRNLMLLKSALLYQLTRPLSRWMAEAQVKEQVKRVLKILLE